MPDPYQKTPDEDWLLRKAPPGLGPAKKWSSLYADALPDLQMTDRGAAADQPTPKYDSPLGGAKAPEGLGPTPPGLLDPASQNRQIMADADKEYADRQAAKGLAETVVRGATPLSKYMETIFGSGMGSPGYGSAEQHLTAMRAQDQDVQRLLGQQQFGQHMGLEQEKLAQAQTLAREHNASQERVAALAHSPEAVQAQLVLRAALDNSIDLPAALDRLGQARQQIAQRSGVPGLPGSAGAGQAGPPSPLGPGTPPLPPSPTATADQLLRQMRPALGTVATGPHGDTFAQKEEGVTPQMVADLTNRMAGADLKDPAVRAELARRVQRGDLGDVSRLQEAVANAVANNYLLAQPPARDQSGAYAGSYAIPGQFRLDEAPATGLFGGLRRRFERGNALGLPYNRLQLEGGATVPFNPVNVNSVYAAGQGNPTAMSAEAKRQLPVQQALLDIIRNRTAPR